MQLEESLPEEAQPCRNLDCKSQPTPPTRYVSPGNGSAEAHLSVRVSDMCSLEEAGAKVLCEFRKSSPDPLQGCLGNTGGAGAGCHLPLGSTGKLKVTSST